MSKSLKEDRNFALKAIDQNASNYKYFRELIYDKKLAIEAIKKDKSNIKYVDT